MTSVKPSATQKVSPFPWQSLVSIVMAIVAGANPLDLIPMVAAIDDFFVMPALLILAFFQYRKWKASKATQMADSAQVIEAEHR